MIQSINQSMRIFVFFVEGGSTYRFNWSRLDGSKLMECVVVLVIYLKKTCFHFEFLSSRWRPPTAELDGQSTFGHNWKFVWITSAAPAADFESQRWRFEDIERNEYDETRRRRSIAWPSHVDSGQIEEFERRIETDRRQQFEHCRPCHASHSTVDWTRIDSGDGSYWRFARHFRIATRCPSASEFFQSYFKCQRRTPPWLRIKLHRWLLIITHVVVYVCEWGAHCIDLFWLVIFERERRWQR